MTTDELDKWAEFHAKTKELRSSADATEWLIDENKRLTAELALRQMHFDCCPYAGESWFYGWAEREYDETGNYYVNPDGSPSEDSEQWWLDRLEEVL